MKLIYIGLALIITIFITDLLFELTILFTGANYVSDKFEKEEMKQKLLECIAFLEEQENKEALSEAYFLYGLLQWNKHDEAKVSFIKALQLSKKYSYEWTKINLSLGILAKNKRDYTEAETYFFNCFEALAALKEENKATYVLSKNLQLCLDKIDSLYNQDMDFNEARRRLEQKCEEFKENNQKHSLNLIYNILSELYYQYIEDNLNTNEDLNTDYAALSLSYYEKINSSFLLYDLSYLADLYFTNDNYEKALDNYNLYIQHHQNADYFIHISMADCLYKLMRFDEAKKEIFYAKNFIEEEKSLGKLSDDRINDSLNIIYSLLSDIYLEEGNAALALAYYEKIPPDDSLYDLEILADLYIKNCQWDKALEIYKIFIETHLKTFNE